MTPSEKLTAAYHLCALKGWDNWTYTHITIRIDENHFLINPFSILYKDVTPDNLILVDMRKPAETYFLNANPTGILLHSALYAHRPDIQSIFHLHTTHGVAVSSMKCGLLPISQFALHFYNSIASHSYSSLILDEKTQCDQVAKDLGPHYTMLLENHGTLTCGTSIEEAFY